MLMLKTWIFKAENFKFSWSNFIKKCAFLLKSTQSTSQSLMLATPSQCPCIAECVKNFKQQSLHCRIQKAGPWMASARREWKKAIIIFQRMKHEEKERKRKKSINKSHLWAQVNSCFKRLIHREKRQKKQQKEEEEIIKGVEKSFNG